MSASQNDNGRAFEYGLAQSLSKLLPAPIIDSVPLKTARRCFDAQSRAEQRHIVAAADEAVRFLAAYDNRLAATGCQVILQSDQAGQHGDVRDIIVQNLRLKEEVGISAKNRHVAVKHSRLSATINFGADWLDVPCTDDYFVAIRPIFSDLLARQKSGQRWAEIPDKWQRYYLPVLEAFRAELTRLVALRPNDVPASLVKYLLGRYDFYKIIKVNGTVSVTSYNIYGTLRWGKRLRMPTEIVRVSPKPGSATTLLIVFDQGWSFSFRIHNASSRVEPSLKFDITLVGSPTGLSTNQITYRGKNVVYVDGPGEAEDGEAGAGGSLGRSPWEEGGYLRCERCTHVERSHSELDPDEPDAVNCHEPGCSCDGFVPPFNLT